MDRIKKEFLLNGFVLSFVLSILYSLFLAYLDKKSLELSHTGSSFIGGYFIVLYFFLGIYLFHIFISIISYLVAQFLGNRIVIRLIIFNMIGMLLIGVIYYFSNDVKSLILLISLLTFSIISIINIKYAIKEAKTK